LDSDLPEVTIAKLHALYAERKYTVTQVTEWYLSRIAHFDSVYRAMIHVDRAGALRTATELDRSRDTSHGPLWGVPIVIKANTSVKGLVTSAGWAGYLIPGHQLIAPRDAPIVAKLRRAGAVILGQTNMPDFAASDANISSAFGRTGNAYDWRFSPGGSSGGTVTAVSANYCVLGTGTDTGNSIRMPAATSGVVGVLPTRGLTSIAGIHPLDWLLDNTGPIARTVSDAATALTVLAGEDPGDFRTADAARMAQSGPYTKYLASDALTGRRLGVPAFIVKAGSATVGGPPLQPETRALFDQALDALRKAGAEVIVDDALMPDSFEKLTETVNTGPYSGEGLEHFLRDFGPADYHSSIEYARVIGSPIPLVGRGNARLAATLESDPRADSLFWSPQRSALAAYDEAFQRYRLDALVYPAIQMPPNDELQPLEQGQRSGGPHSSTAWVNRIGVPAVSVPGGRYESGLPFGVEFSGRRWRDGDLLGVAFAFEQATKSRRPPVLVDHR
jgi:Asp-tRNA(Asn)/Glu-tRNA(Gln) amidotransferase A subunit family amidase